MTKSPQGRLVLAALMAAFQSACSGTASAAPVEQSSAAVEIVPASAQVNLGGPVLFSAVVTGIADTRVLWSVTESGGGTIDPSGHYTAPQTLGSYHVVVRSVMDASASATALVTVTVPPVVAVTVSPKTPSLATGATQTFTATVTGTTNTSVTWSIEEGAAGGGISSAGVYTAPSTAGTYHVVATSQADASKSDTATVTVTSSGGTVRSKLDLIATRKWWWGHMSVGSETMGYYDPTGSTFSIPYGMLKILADNPGSAVKTLRTTSASSISVGTLGNAQLNDSPLTGVNSNPASKMAAFKAAMDAGIGNAVDFAFVKLGFVDQAMLFADQSTPSPPNLSFGQYQAIMAGLQAAYPNTKFLHATISLSEYPHDYNNDQADAWNQMLKATYPGSDIFDVAWWDSHDGSGTLCHDTFSNDHRDHPALCPVWAANDGGHLSNAGANMMAGRLVDFLASQVH